MTTALLTDEELDVIASFLAASGMNDAAARLHHLYDGLMAAEAELATLVNHVQTMIAAHDALIIEKAAYKAGYSGPTWASVRETASRILHQLPLAAQALLAELAGLRANQRTPGFIETCPECSCQPNLNLAGPQPHETCRYGGCPIKEAIRSQKETPRTSTGEKTV